MEKFGSDPALREQMGGPMGNDGLKPEAIQDESRQPRPFFQGRDERFEFRPEQGGNSQLQLPKGEFSPPPGGGFQEPTHDNQPVESFPKESFNQPSQSDFGSPQGGGFKGPPGGSFGEPPRGDSFGPPGGGFQVGSTIFTSGTITKRIFRPTRWRLPRAVARDNPPAESFPKESFNQQPSQGDFTRPRWRISRRHRASHLQLLPAAVEAVTLDLTRRFWFSIGCFMPVLIVMNTFITKIPD